MFFSKKVHSLIFVNFTYFLDIDNVGHLRERYKAGAGGSHGWDDTSPKANKYEERFYVPIVGGTNILTYTRIFL